MRRMSPHQARVSLAAREVKKYKKTMRVIEGRIKVLNEQLDLTKRAMERAEYIQQEILKGE